MPRRDDQPWKIALCGPSESGKDEAAKWFAANTPLRNPGSTSRFLCPYVVALKHGVPVAEVQAGLHTHLYNFEFSQRHLNKVQWFNLGNVLRAIDPMVLVTQVLDAGDILNGARNREEILRSKSYRLVHRVLWIERDVPPDPTMTYGPEVADLSIDNNGDLAAFHARLAEFCESVSIPLYTATDAR